jgi:dTDP-4-dehydrorhamnose reductase
VAEWLERSQPNWLLHCAAATNVDWCEAHPEEARILNVDVSRQLAILAHRFDVNLLYVSTDSVFDGTREAYSETDSCAPLNVYAATKLAGETAVRRALPEALVVRTNMFGWKQTGRPSLAEWILQELRAERPVPAFSDVVFTPLLVNDLSEVLLEMMERRLSGVYHVGGASACSKYEFARLVAQIFELREDLVRPTAVHESALRALRPQNTTLDSGKIVAALGRPLPPVSDAMQRLRTLWNAGFPATLKRLRGESG